MFGPAAGRTAASQDSESEPARLIYAHFMGTSTAEGHGTCP